MILTICWIEPHEVSLTSYNSRWDPSKGDAVAHQEESDERDCENDHVFSEHMVLVLRSDLGHLKQAEAYEHEEHEWSSCESPCSSHSLW